MCWCHALAATGTCWPPFCWLRRWTGSDVLGARDGKVGAARQEFENDVQFMRAEGRPKFEHSSLDWFVDGLNWLDRHWSDAHFASAPILGIGNAFYISCFFKPVDKRGHRSGREPGRICQISGRRLLV